MLLLLLFKQNIVLKQLTRIFFCFSLMSVKTPTPTAPSVYFNPLPNYILLPPIFREHPTRVGFFILNQLHKLHIADMIRRHSWYPRPYHLLGSRYNIHCALNCLVRLLKKFHLSFELDFRMFLANDLWNLAFVQSRCSNAVSHIRARYECMIWSCEFHL